MTLLSYNELCKLVDNNVINANPENINGASIDITLDEHILVEDDPCDYIINLADKENINTRETTISDNGYLLYPGQFILACSIETFNLPSDIVAEYILKSSLARNGLNHMLAGYCDPGWTQSKLTMEFKNETQSHKLLLTKGMKCGQVKFYRVEPVPDEASYSFVGQYNNQAKATASKGVR